MTGDRRRQQETTAPHARTGRRGGRLRLLLSLLCLAPLAVIFWPTTAEQTIRNQPASEGRRLTPAGELLLDATTRQPAVGALPVAFVRSPDTTGPGGAGRYLVAVCSGYGLQFNAATNKAQQSLQVLDLNAQPAPVVVQNIYFPTPQSAHVGVVFAPHPAADGSYPLYVSGGVENKIWLFTFRPGGRAPITPPSPGPDTKVSAPAIDVSGFADVPPDPRTNRNFAPVYPTGLALSQDGDTLFVANNLGDSLGLVHDPHGRRVLANLRLDPQPDGQGTRPAGPCSYPYDVAALPAPARRAQTATASENDMQTDAPVKVFVSCWGSASVAVVHNVGATGAFVARTIAVARHPTQMLLDAPHARLYVVNSNADSVSVLDTAHETEVERIDVRLSERAPIGSSPEGLALSADGRTLYVANAHANAVAVVNLSARARGVAGSDAAARTAAHTAARSLTPTQTGAAEARSRVRGYIPTGQYPSALAVVDDTLFIANGKGTGVRNSSLVVDDSGRVPNLPNDRFPTGTGRSNGQGGEYSVPIVVGNISLVATPDVRQLARYTQQVMRNNGLLDPPQSSRWRGRTPFKHVIYVIKENRSYDQVFGDLARAGDGTRADGDPALAIFGAGAAARRPGGPAQNVTPNQHALALRFGLLDRFFVNAEASADGHNWSTAAFSTDYTDKAFRWNYADRGRSYDFEGFNRLPDYRPAAAVTPPPAPLPPDSRPPQRKAPALPLPATAADLAAFVRRFVPYLHGGRDVAEPETRYLWDAAARAGLSYRNYGEFIGTESEAFVRALNEDQRRTYPDITPTAFAIPTKPALEGHHSTTCRNFDMLTPDAMTVASYRAASAAHGALDPLISSAHSEPSLRGHSRLGDWLAEFNAYVADLQAGRGDHLPHLSILRLPNDHTEGVTANMPTAQFYVADNDYAVGRLVEAVSHSPYWRDTAILIVEDDAQDGPDHVDAHRAPALVISAYNRPGALVHTFHNTVSLIRTIEVLLGIAPMNLLDATAAPIDIFRTAADLRPYTAVLPDIAHDNLLNPPAPRTPEEAFWMRRSAAQDLSHADQADPTVLNQAIWYSVRGGACPLPVSAHLPAFDALLPAGAVPDESAAVETAQAGWHRSARKRD